VTAVVAIPDGHAARVDLGRHLVPGVVDEQLAAGHAGADLVLDRAQDQHPPARQVLAGVLAGGLGHDGRAGVADAEAVAGPPADEHRAAGRPVADVVAGHALDLPAVARPVVVERHHHRPAGDALGHAVLGKAAQLQVEAVDAPGPEALPRLALEAHPQALVVGHPLAP